MEKKERLTCSLVTAFFLIIHYRNKAVSWVQGTRLKVQSNTELKELLFEHIPEGVCGVVEIVPEFPGELGINPSFALDSTYAGKNNAIHR